MWGRLTSISKACAKKNYWVNSIVYGNRWVIPILTVLCLEIRACGGVRAYQIFMFPPDHRMYGRCRLAPAHQANHGQAFLSRASSTANQPMNKTSLTAPILGSYMGVFKGITATLRPQGTPLHRRYVKGTAPNEHTPGQQAYTHGANGAQK